MRSKHAAVGLVWSVALLAAAAGEARAQACVGVPVGGGEFAVLGHASFTDGATGYGGGIRANVRGPLSVGVGYTLTDFEDIEENANSFGGSLAFEMPSIALSACPVIGANYSRISGQGTFFDQFDAEATVTTLVVPVGFGIGRAFPAAPNVRFAPFIIPEYLYIRSTADVTVEGFSEEATETESEFGARFGAVLAVRRILVGATFSVTTIEDSDPVLSLVLGLGL